VALAEPLAVTSAIALVLDKLEIPYLVGGSLASSMHGIPRATQDIDIVADIRIPHVAGLVKELSGTWYIDENQIREAIKLRSSFNIIHLESMYKVDVFIAGNDPASITEMARKINFPLNKGEVSICIASAEDIILRKLVWFNKGGQTSQRQWDDVAGVAKLQKDSLDMKYLLESAAEMGISQLLDKLISQTRKKTE
jgi:hypothetical protein